MKTAEDKDWPAPSYGWCAGSSPGITVRGLLVGSADRSGDHHDVGVVAAGSGIELTAAADQAQFLGGTISRPVEPGLAEHRRVKWSLVAFGGQLRFVDGKPSNDSITTVAAVGHCHGDGFAEVVRAIFGQVGKSSGDAFPIDVTGEDDGSVVAERGGIAGGVQPADCVDPICNAFFWAGNPHFAIAGDSVWQH